MIIWTDYMKYRAQVREFDLPEVERILRYGQERYLDVSSGRRVVIGHHGNVLVMIPYEQDGEAITPVTIHATSRQQIAFRLRSGRFSYE